MLRNVSFSLGRHALFGGVLVAAALPASAGSNPFAVEVISYVAGSDPSPGYTDATVALGSPERFTGEWTDFGGATTPFNAPWGPTEVVSIGTGGSLTLRFDEPITNDPSHLFGVDLLVFGNGFFTYDNGVASTLSAEGPFQISVSANGMDFVPVQGDYVDSFFPTLGYADAIDPFLSPAGQQPTDFTRPMNPSLTPADFIGRDLNELLALYNGSGGGVPIDIASANLASVSYVRIEAPFAKIEVDAVAVVPEPQMCVLALLGFAAMRKGGRNARS